MERNLTAGSAALPSPAAAATGRQGRYTTIMPTD